MDAKYNNVNTTGGGNVEMCDYEEWKNKAITAHQSHSSSQVIRHVNTKIKRLTLALLFLCMLQNSTNRFRRRGQKPLTFCEHQEVSNGSTLQIQILYCMYTVILLTDFTINFFLHC
jgi:hypothetical protein